MQIAFARCPRSSSTSHGSSATKTTPVGGKRANSTTFNAMNPERCTQPLTRLRAVRIITESGDRRDHCERPAARRTFGRREAEPQMTGTPSLFTPEFHVR